MYVTHQQTLDIKWYIGASHQSSFTLTATQMKFCRKLYDLVVQEFQKIIRSCSSWITRISTHESDVLWGTWCKYFSLDPMKMNATRQHRNQVCGNIHQWPITTELHTALTTMPCPFAANPTFNFGQFQSVRILLDRRPEARAVVCKVAIKSDNATHLEEPFQIVNLSKCHGYQDQGFEERPQHNTWISVVIDWKNENT